MIQLRKNTGATLALIIAATIIVILVGIGVFFLMQIVGGQRELENATRSGNLNVAKQAIQSPSTTMPFNSTEYNQFNALTDQVGGQRVVDLRVYNRLVGQALLVAMNAEVDPNKTGKANAKKVFDLLQAQNGIGDRLSKALGDHGQTNTFFTSVGFTNSTRMLGQSPFDKDDKAYAIAWMDQRPGDLSETNLIFPQPNQIPAGYNVSNSFITVDPTDIDPVTGKKKEYLKGYNDLNFAGIGTLQGVPVQPGKQPHLVSQNDFAPQQKLPNAAIHVPPNAFQSGGQKVEARTSKTSYGVSRALVGALGADYRPSIPNGYILVVNGGGVNQNGTMNSNWGVLNNDLDPTAGIYASPGSEMFSPDQNLMNAWVQHNQAHQMQTDPVTGKTVDLCAMNPPQCQNPGVQNLYDKNGNQATVKQAHNITGSTKCDDTNTGTKNPTQPCGKLFNSGAFDKALSPPGGSYITGNQQGNNLMALEALKCDIIGQFNHPGHLHPSTNANVTTGLRVYFCKPSQECKWPYPGTATPKCQISKDGTIAELFDMVAGGPNSGAGAKADAFITQRMHQMDPTITADDIKTILNQPVPMSPKPYYIYVDSNHKAHFDQNPPPGSNVAQAPDGTAFLKQRGPLNVLNTLTNPHHENNIHDQLFRCQSGQVFDTNTAEYIPSSGYNNLLGEVKFTDKAKSSGTYLDCPD